MEEMLKVVGLLGGLALGAIGIKWYGDCKKKEGTSETMDVFVDIYGPDKVANDLIDYKNGLIAKAKKG